MIPAKYNLVLRGCSSNGFLECDFYNNLWHLILRWLGIYTVQPGGIGVHALQFGGSHVFRKEIRGCFPTIWLVCIFCLFGKREIQEFLTINIFL